MMAHRLRCWPNTKPILNIVLFWDPRKRQKVTSPGLMLGHRLRRWTSIKPPSQQTRGIQPMPFPYWPIVFDAGPLFKQHWLNSPCSLGYWACPAEARRWINVRLTLVYCLRRWPNIQLTLIQCLVSTVCALLRCPGVEIPHYKQIVTGWLYTHSYHSPYVCVLIAASHFTERQATIKTSYRHKER